MSNILSCFPQGEISGHDREGKKRKREQDEEQDEDQNLTNTSCPPEQGQSDEEAKEEHLADELEDIEDELRDADDNLHAGLEQDLSDALNGEVPNLKDDDEGVVEEELNMERGEKNLFEEWVKQCRERHQHVYITNIITGECTCPDQATYSGICVQTPYQLP